MSTYRLLFADDVAAAERELEERGARLLHVLAPGAIVGMAERAGALDGLASASPHEPQDLARLPRLAAAAWRRNEGLGFPAPRSRSSAPPAPRRRSAEISRTLREQALLMGRRQRELLGEPELELIPPASSQVLRGSVTLALIVVSGPGELAFTDAEAVDVLAAFQRATTELHQRWPAARISWRTHPIELSVDVPDPSACSEIEACEANWRDPAMAQLGWEPGLERVAEYVLKLRELEATDWACAAFATLYRLGHFAYAGGVRMCLEWSEWKARSTTMDASAVVEHEAAHLFGAEDEYAQSRATCAPSGIFKVPNRNYIECASSQRRCLMATGDDPGEPLCPWTPGQLGWRQTWQAGIAPPAELNLHSTLATPGAVRYGDTLFLLYRDARDSTLRSLSCTNNTWSVEAIVNARSADSPTPVVFNGMLYAFYRGLSSKDLCYSWYEQGAWRGNVRIKDRPGKVAARSNNRPAAAVIGEKLMLIYRGGEHTALVTATYDGGIWSGGRRIEEQSSIAPASATTPGAAVTQSRFGERLTILYRGAESSSLSTADFDGKNWSGNVKIADQPGGISPQSKFPPTLVEYGDLLYALYQATDGVRILYAMRGPDTDPFWWGDLDVAKARFSDPQLVYPFCPAPLVDNGILTMFYVSWEKMLGPGRLRSVVCT